jgi:hypothetical protein
MKTLKTAAIAAVAALMVLPTISLAQYGNEGNRAGSGVFSILGGVQGLNKNRTTWGNNPFVDIPVVADLGYNFAPSWAAVGEFSWLIPVRRSVTENGVAVGNRRTPDILTYQANLLYHVPFANSTLAPYVTGGVGAMSFLKNADADQQPQLLKTYTPFALNFGVGAMIGLSSTQTWALQADLREFAAFPTKSMAGLANGSSGNTLWMERATLGVAYHF